MTEAASAPSQGVAVVLKEQRREGKGRGDASRLFAGERLRRADVVEEVVRPSRSAFVSSTHTLKHGEPHDRLQGETDLRSHWRSKPSKSGGTTWTERVGRLDGDSPKNGRRLVWEWTLVVVRVEGRFDEPHERSSREGGAGNGVVDLADKSGRYVSSKETLLESNRSASRGGANPVTLHMVVGSRSQNAKRGGKDQRPFTVCGRHRATEGRTIRKGTLEGRLGARVAIHEF